MKKFKRFFKELDLIGKIAVIGLSCWVAGSLLLVVVQVADPKITASPSIVLALIGLVFLAIGGLCIAASLLSTLVEWLMKRRRKRKPKSRAPLGAGKEGKEMNDERDKEEGRASDPLAVASEALRWASEAHDHSTTALERAEKAAPVWTAWLSMIGVVAAVAALVLSLCISGPAGPPGPQGDTGPQGEQGAQGYQVTVEDLAADSTFVATVAEELAKLRPTAAPAAPAAPRPKPRSIWE